MKTHIVFAQITGTAAAAVLFLGCGSVVAQDSKAPAADAPNTNRWETTAAAGITLTRGNSDTFLATLGIDTKRKWDKNELGFGLNGGYGENDEVKNTDFVQGFGQYNRLFTDRFFAGIRVDGNYDGIAELDYRFRITPMAGYYVVKNPKTSLAFELGPSAVFEKHKYQSESTYLGIRIAERFEHKLTDSTKIWQTVEYVPQVDYWVDKYVINFEAGIDTAITKHWSLRVLLQDVYDNNPTPGRKENDIRLIAGTAYKF